MSTSNKILNSIIGILLIIGISVVIIKNKIVPNFDITNIPINTWFVILSIPIIISSLIFSILSAILNHKENLNVSIIIKDSIKNTIISVLSYSILYALFDRPQIIFSITVLIFNVMNTITSLGHTQISKADAFDICIGFLLLIGLLILTSILFGFVACAILNMNVFSTMTFFISLLIANLIEHIGLNIGMSISTIKEINYRRNQKVIGIKRNISCQNQIEY